MCNFLLRSIMKYEFFFQTRDCRMSLQLLIKCLLDYSHETDFCIWYDMVKNFDSLHQLLQNKQRDEIWAKFAIPFFHNIWMVVGWEKKQDERKENDYRKLRRTGRTGVQVYLKIFSIKSLAKKLSICPIPAV